MTWAIIRTTSGQEQPFAERLTETGQSFFCPTVTIVRRPSGMRFPTKATRARFPGYLFVLSVTVDYLSPVWHDRRFMGFIKLDGEIYQLPDEQLAPMRAWDGCESVPEVAEVQFTPGELVRLLSGPYEGKCGFLKPMNGGAVVDGHDFARPVRVNDLKKLQSAVQSVA